MSSLSLDQSSTRLDVADESHSLYRLSADTPVTLAEESDNADSDRISQRSISLSSPTTSIHSPQDSLNKFLRGLGQHDEDSELTAIPLDASSEDQVQMQSVELVKDAIQPPPPSTSTIESERSTSQVSQTSISRSTTSSSIMTYPPTHIQHEADTASMMSYSSTSSRKARPESQLLEPSTEPLVPGIALVDFNHLVHNAIHTIMLMRTDWMQLQDRSANRV